MKTNLKNMLFSSLSDILVINSTLLLFRVLVSLSMINTHGIKKLIDFEGTIKHIPDPLGVGGEVSAIIAIIANIIAPIFIIIGLGTRLAVLPILSVTLIGFLIVHGKDPWAVKDIPLMYSLSYLLILFIGPGNYSIDHKLFKLS